MGAHINDDGRDWLEAGRFPPLPSKVVAQGLVNNQHHGQNCVDDDDRR